MDHYEHVMDTVSISPQSVGFPRFLLHELFLEAHLRLPPWLDWSLQLRSELLPHLATLKRWLAHDNAMFYGVPPDLGARLLSSYPCLDPITAPG